MTTASTHVSLDEFLQLPEEKPALEYMNGIVSPRDGIVSQKLDQLDRSVLAFRPNAAAVAWRAADTIDLSEILPSFDLTVEQLFASLRHE